MSVAAARVLIPLVRRAMPTLIANQIIGVSPLSAPAGTMFAAPLHRRRWPVDPALYRHFLRVNNRKRTQSGEDLRRAGYWSASRGWFSGHARVDAWCRDQWGPHAWHRFPGDNTWWFSREDDALVFRLAWCGDDQ
jgi:hypothetical protein